MGKTLDISTAARLVVAQQKLNEIMRELRRELS